MAQSSFPFENVDTTETQFSQMFRTLNAGVNGTPAGTELKVTAGTGLQVSVALGQAMVRGHYYISTAAELLTIGTANATNPRIDTIVLRLDPVANSIVLAVVAGTAAASPVAPTLTQTDAGTYEFPLANVAVAAGAGTVGTITDRRVFMGKRLQSVGTSAARDIVFPSPVQGDMVWRDDLGATETYYGLYNSTTNPGGRDSAGWYSATRQSGLVPIQPASVTIASGSGSANSLGLVTFTNATAISLNNVFTSEYKSYRIIVNEITPSTAGITFNAKMRLNGSDNGSAAYEFHGARQFAANAVGQYDGTAATNWALGTYTSRLSLSMDIHSPALPITTTANALSSQWVSGVGYGGAFAGLAHTVNTAYDGITFYPASGTVSGTIQVLGYTD